MCDDDVLRDVAVFVSVGDVDKLRAFLDANPFIDADRAYVDGYERLAYKAMGLELFTETDPQVAKDASKNLAAPDLGGMGGWWNYMKNAAKLAPVEKLEFGGGVPEGVLQLGATFVVKDGQEVTYAWKDPLPGVTPPLDELRESLKSLIQQS